MIDLPPAPTKPPREPVFQVVRWRHDDHEVHWKPHPGQRAFVLLEHASKDDLENLRGALDDFLRRWWPREIREAVEGPPPSHWTARSSISIS